MGRRLVIGALGVGRQEGQGSEAEPGQPENLTQNRNPGQKEAVSAEDA